MPSPPTCTTVQARSGAGSCGDRCIRGSVFTGGVWRPSPQQLEVNGTISGVNQELLLDTGASMSLTAPHFFEESNPELAAYIERNMRPTSQGLVGCNGKRSKCRGVVALRLKVGSYAWTEPEVYVLDSCPHPLIVSWPSLVREDFCLFSKRGQIQFGEEGELVDVNIRPDAGHFCAIPAEVEETSAASPTLHQREEPGLVPVLRGLEKHWRAAAGAERSKCRKRVRWNLEAKEGESDMLSPTTAEEPTLVRSPSSTTWK